MRNLNIFSIDFPEVLTTKILLFTVLVMLGQHCDNEVVYNVVYHI